jgi:hypothetical protein
MWYLAKIVYRIVCGDGEHTPQFDEQLRLIQANNDLHAFRKAKLLGEQEQDCFLNNVDKPVRWQFIDVAEIHALNELIDGAEMYSKIYESNDADAYIHTTHLKAHHLLQNSIHGAVRLN